MAQVARAASCHPDRRDFAKGLCQRCYHKTRHKRWAECHANSVEFAGGLCRRCYREKELSKPASCHPDKSNWVGGLCLSCYTQTPQQKANLRKRYLRKTYGMTVEEFDRMLITQGGRCAICGEEDPNRVDHNHETGDVRGLLCNQCNSGLGCFKDSPANITNALKYLTERGFYGK